MLLSVSSRGDYGFLMMSSLAEGVPGEFVRLSEITALKKVPLPYASQIMTSLKKAGLVESREGVSGGYRLTKPASEINLSDIVEALEGPIAPVKCMTDNCHCSQENVCSMKPIWQESAALLKKHLSKKKLSDIVKQVPSA